MDSYAKDDIALTHSTLILYSLFNNCLIINKQNDIERRPKFILFKIMSDISRYVIVTNVEVVVEYQAESEPRTATSSYSHRSI